MNAKHFSIVLPGTISKNLSLQPDRMSISELTELLRTSSLTVPISADISGNIISLFSDPIWDLWPYHFGKGNDDRAILDFRFLKNDPELCLQVKLIFYLWMRYSSHRIMGYCCKTTTLYSRLCSIKYVLEFLKTKNLSSLESLTRPEIWPAFLVYIEDCKLSFGVLSNMLSMLKAITYISCNLPFCYKLPKFNNHLLASTLACPTKKITKQHFAIPSRIMDILYGEAVKMVEAAWPHRDAIAEARKLVQENFKNAKTKVDNCIDYGIPIISLKTVLTINDRQTHSAAYRNAIKNYQELRPKDIVDKFLKPHGLGPPSPEGNGIDYYFSRLLTACYICTIGFTGMRCCEAYQLKPHCYQTRVINKMTFHVVQGATHKYTDGLKPDEWLCAPITGNAIELAEAITRTNRDDMLLEAKHRDVQNDTGTAQKLRQMAECLWLTRPARHKQSKPINSHLWGTYLKLYAARCTAIVTEQDIIEFHRINRNVSTKNLPEQGKAWKFSPHQSRRTFAVFGKDNNLIGVSATRQQFKHVRLRATEYYRNGSSPARGTSTHLDIGLRNLLSQSQIDHETSDLYEIFNGDSFLSGGKGKHIFQERNQEPLKYKDYNLLRHLVETGKITYHSTGTAGCMNGYKCEMDSITNPAFCVECTGAVITIKHANNWKYRHTQTAAYFNSNNPLSMNEISHFSLIIKAAEKVLTDFEIEFDPVKLPRI